MSRFLHLKVLDEDGGEASREASRSVEEVEGGKEPELAEERGPERETFFIFRIVLVKTQLWRCLLQWTRGHDEQFP